jgi:hypothetical protein
MLSRCKAAPAKEAHEGDEMRDAELYATKGVGEREMFGCGERGKGAIG